MTAGAGLSAFALVSSAICFSGASSGDFMSICHSEGSRGISVGSEKSNPAVAGDFARHDKNGSSSCDFILHKTWFRRGRVSSVFRRAKTSPRFAPAVPTPRRLSSARNVPRSVMVPRETARNRFPKSSHSLRPPVTRPLVLPSNAQLRLPLKRLDGASAHLLLGANEDPDASPAECLGPRRLRDRHATRGAT